MECGVADRCILIFADFTLPSPIWRATWRRVPRYSVTKYVCHFIRYKCEGLLIALIYSKQLLTKHDTIKIIKLLTFNNS